MNIHVYRCALKVLGKPEGKLVHGQSVWVQYGEWAISFTGPGATFIPAQTCLSMMTTAK